MEFILPRLQLGRRQGPNVGLDVSSSFSSEVCAAGVADGGLRCLLKQSVCDGLAITPACARLFCSTNSVQIVCTNFRTIPNFFQMLARAASGAGRGPAFEKRPPAFHRYADAGGPFLLEMSRYVRMSPKFLARWFATMRLSMGIVKPSPPSISLMCFSPGGLRKCL